MPYQAADGHNNEAGLANLNPQPATPEGVQTPRRVYAPSGSSPDGEPFVDLTYSTLEDDQFNAINTALGVSRTTTSNEVTMRIKEDTGSFANYNAVANYPERLRRSLVGWENVVYRIQLKEAL